MYQNTTIFKHHIPKYSDTIIGRYKDTPNTWIWSIISVKKQNSAIAETKLAESLNTIMSS